MYLSHKSVEIAHKLTDAMAATFKADAPDENADRMREKVRNMLQDLAIDWSDLPAQVRAVLEPFVKGAAADGLAQIEVSMQAAVELANDRATLYASQRAAEMVGMKYDTDGKLVPNPKAEWVISESTRDMIQELVTKAIAEGWSNDRLAAAIGNDAAFGDDRAMMIARTETAMADVQGNMAAYHAASDLGIELQKEWLTANDDDVSDECAANQDEGPIDLGQAFSSGDDAAPAHPNCRCDILPVRFPRGAENVAED